MVKLVGKSSKESQLILWHLWGPNGPTKIPPGSYTWKRLGKPLNMEKTLAENGMEELVMIDVGLMFGQLLGGSFHDLKEIHPPNLQFLGFHDGHVKKDGGVLGSSHLVDG